MKFCYSRDGEHYETDDLESFILENELEDGDTYWRGEVKHLEAADFVSVAWLIDHMKDSLYEKAGEYADDYMDTLDDSEKLLHAAICEWIDDNLKCPVFTAENCTQMTVVRA